MSNRRRSFVLQADVVRSLKAVRAAGVSEERITGVKITAAGDVFVLLGDQADNRAFDRTKQNEWDVVLK